MMVRLPFELGADQAMVATPVFVNVLVLAFASTLVGTLGASAIEVTSSELDAALDALWYEPLSALTLNV